jgi:leucyl aminopeptidase
MRTAYTTPDVAVTSRPTADLDADLLVVPVFADDDFADEPGMDAAAGGEIARARARGEFTGTPYDVFVTGLTGWKAPRVALVGAGPRAACTPDHLRRVAIVGALAARQRHLLRIAVLHRSGTSAAPEVAAQVMAEGVCLANYDGGNYKTEDAQRVWLQIAELRIAGDASLQAAADRGRILGEASNQARLLANEPGNSLTPRVFAEHAVQIGQTAGLQIEVLDEKQMAALNMGLLLGVARGSQEPPRLVVLRHEPADAIPGVFLALVGKGITFETGGISIKPAENMDKM